MKVLLTGGNGYIGSHTTVELLNNNFEVIVVDNFSNSKRDVKEKIEKITKKSYKLYEGDIKDKKLLENIFEKENIDAVIHFAGYKAVAESVIEPLKYYDNNLIGTINLLEVMKKYNCKKLVFSSSATVYGKPQSLPIYENFKTTTTNPYGTTKLFIEQILTDYSKSLEIKNETFYITILRYFNPIGAHKSGLIGENPNDIPNNLMPYITKVATGQIDVLKIFGNDYNTKDGTGVRDYIHVVDLAKAHVLAVENFKNNLNIYNVGTGNGFSVLELVNTFKKVNNIDVPYIITDRRIGDVDACYACCDKIFKELGFKAIYGIEDMCKDSYTFAINNKEK